MIEQLKPISDSVIPRKIALMAAVGILVLLALVVFIRYSSPPHYSNDSWSYYELSKNFFSDFYRVNTWRQFQFTEPYGVSFPPLWPFCIAVFNAVFRSSYYAGYLLNFVVLAALCIVLFKLAKTVFGQSTFGFPLCAWLIANPFFMDELVAGRSMPLAILLFVLVVLIWISPREMTYPRVALAGFLCGLIVMDRFDFLLAAVAAGFLYLIPSFDSRLGVRIKSLLVHTGAALVPLAPWIAYSEAHFGTLLVSDNSRTALSAIPTFVTDFIPSPPPTIFSRPGAWLTRYLAGLPQFGKGFAVFVLPPILVFVVAWTARRRLEARRGAPGGEALPRRIFWPAPLLLIQLALISATGFHDARYFIGASLYACMLALTVLVIFSMSGGPRWILPTVLVVPGIILAGMIGWYAIEGFRESPDLVSAVRSMVFRPSDPAALAAPAETPLNPLSQMEASAYSCVRADTEARILDLEGNAFIACRFGAMTGIKVYIWPRNYIPALLPKMISLFGINQIAALPEMIVPAERFLELEKRCNLPLWRIVRSR